MVRHAKILALLGDWAYTVALALNRYFNQIRRRLGYPYWSLSAWLKLQVKEAVKAIDRFETALADDARRRGFDGVVCGHIHHAEMRDVNGVLYLTTATGWKAAPPWSSMRTAGWNWSTGWRGTSCASWPPHGPPSPPLPERLVRAVAAPVQPSAPRRVLIVSDAWQPQVNGVVRTLSTVAGELADMGHVVDVIGPDRFRTVPLPTYPDIRLAVLPRRSSCGWSRRSPRKHCISPPKARSAWPRAAGRGGAAPRSPPRSTRGSGIYAGAHRHSARSPMPGCAGSMAAAPA